MLSWLTQQKSTALENAKARARERAREAAPEGTGVPSGEGRPSQDGLVVEELSAEEFLRLFPQGDRRV